MHMPSEQTRTRGRLDDEEERPVAKRPRGPPPGGLHRKTRKVAMFLAYSGTRYHGMQVNPGVVTVEGELLAALERCGLISGVGRESQTAIHFSRAARTDKGVSASCQCVSMRIPCEVNGEIDDEVLAAINEQLPVERDIQLLSIVRATSSFSARGDCHRRIYEYILPLQEALGGANGLEARPDGKPGDVRVARLNSILSAYVGTKCYANFTDSKVKAGEAAAMRYMLSVEAGEPYSLSQNGVLYVSVFLHGQSFVLYQIRKMIGLALAIFSGVVPEETMEVALSPHVRMTTPTAPPMFLLLDDLDFSAYDTGVGKNLAHPINVDGRALAMKSSFKQAMIYREIDRENSEYQFMAAWMLSLRENNRYDKARILDDHRRFVSTTEGIEEDRRRVVAAQYPVTRDVETFICGASAEETGRFSELLSHFHEWTGSPPKCVVRAPGRVNLIGEHCDYNDFGVIGIATKQGTYIAGGHSENEEVSVLHMENASCGAGSFDRKGLSVAEGSGDWTQYVAWGWAAMMRSSHIPKSNSTGSACLLVSGDLPRAAGLGSSSSLVTASALTAARLSRVRLGREELALIAAEGERVGAGTRGGAVDHTMSMCGVSSSATLVSFSPKLETRTLRIPAGASFVVVNSGVKAFKGQHDGTKILFNTRVIESRIGAALVARRLKTHLAKTVSTPGQLYNMERAAGRVTSVGELLARVRTVTSIKDEIVLLDAMRELELSEDSSEWRKRFLMDLTFDPTTCLKVGRRLEHVFSEADRVDQFRNLLESESKDDGSQDEDVVRRLGAMVSASHASLRYNYECSVAEVDELVQYCLDSGSAGSRITGAGWGGCVLSLVPRAAVAVFVARLRERVGKSSVFVAEPSAGACVLAM